MSRYISEDLRHSVSSRANERCEYCLMPEVHSFFSFHIDHIISIKHEGKTEADNLAYTCPYCNRNKGSDIASVLLPENMIVRLFNPRIDHWASHFRYEDASINPLTDIGRVTEKILDFNHPDRIAERQLLIELGLVKF